jgi:hypothetical protein
MPPKPYQLILPENIYSMEEEGEEGKSSTEGVETSSIT